MYYSKPVKPIRQIKIEISSSANKIRYSLIGIIVSMLVGYTLFMLFWVGDMYFMFFFTTVSIGAFVMIGIGVYGLFHLYRISKNFEDLGDHYWQHTQSAKKAAEMLKIALIVAIVTGGVVGIVLYIIACNRIAETFKELNYAGLYPKKEDRFLLYSVVAIGIVFFLIVATWSSMWFTMVNWHYMDLQLFITIFVSIAEFLLITGIIVHIIALTKFSNNTLLILEKEPSPRQMPPQVVYGQAQPVPPQASYYAPAPKATSMPSEHKAQVVDESRQFCSQCGETVNETNEFCPYCGNYLK